MGEIFELPLGGSNNLYEEVVKTALDNRILIFNQEVDDSLVEDIIMHILMWNIEDAGLPADKRKPCTIILNSCGGDVFTALNCVDIISESVTPVRCIAMGLVASAAYYIYLSCHERIAFKNSAFLQHDGSITVSSTGAKSKQTLGFFDQMDQRVKNLVLEKTTMGEEFYDKNYDVEFYFYADKGKELGVVDAIIGEDISMDEAFCL